MPRTLPFIIPLLAAASACATELAPLGTTEDALESCVSLPVAADATLSSTRKYRALGELPTLIVRRDSARDLDLALLRFELGAVPPGAAIASARLELTTHGDADPGCDGQGPGHDAHAARVLVHRAAAPWSEATVTFASFDQQFDAAVIAMLDAGHGTTRRSADVTAQVRSWVAGLEPEHGFLLESRSERRTTIVSRDGGHPDQRPSLRVCYTTAPIDPCEPDPCDHGTCVAAGDGHTCACEPGWSGPSCATDVDDCAGAPCQHGGVCTDGIDSHACACEPGYAGVDCEIDVDDCAAEPCQHGGTCADAVGGYVCTCAPGYEGADCEIDVDDCAGQPCANGGTCVDAVDGFSCACAPGYGGATCEIDLDECAGDPCLHGGACLDLVGGYECRCVYGYTGANCEIDVDDCWAQFCDHGLCVDGVASFTCACEPGYTGLLCDVDIDECAADDAGGCAQTCVNTPGSHQCACETGNLNADGATCDRPLLAFRPVVAHHVTGGLVGELAAADFDGDGLADVAVSDVTGDAVRVLRNRGDHRFGAPVVYGVHRRPYAIAAGDLDGDGDIDLATVHGEDRIGQSIDVLRNRGDGTFERADPQLTLPSPSQLAIADLTGDGLADLVVLSTSRRGVTVLRNAGGGAFDPWYEAAVGGSQYPVALAVGDVNGDGRLDVAAAIQSVASVRVLINTGTGLATGVPYVTAPGVDSVSAVAIADVHGDGHPDLVVTNKTSSTVAVLRNAGDGTFASAVRYPVGLAPSSVAVGDVDGDGDRDLAVAAGGASTVSILTNQGAGAFAAAVARTLGDAPRSLALADVSGDGALDVAGVAGGEVATLLNSGTGGFPGHAAGGLPLEVALGDLDGDGTPELVVADHGAGTTPRGLHVLASTGPGRHAAAVSYPVAGRVRSVAIGDVDGDGDLDAVTATSLSQVQTLLGLGGGALAYGPAASLSSAIEPTAVRLADLDGDGAPDLLVADPTASRLYQLRNVGGAFVEVAAHQVGNGPYDVTAADVDGDGDLDLVVAVSASYATLGPGGAVVLTNLGGGAFAAPVPVFTGPRTFRVALADLDGDGDQDLASLTEGALELHANDGAGAFTPFASVPIASFAFTVTDLDGDARPDVAVATGDGVVVLVNGPDGTFAPASFAAGYDQDGLTAGDLDGDGRPELVAVGSHGAIVLRNTTR